MNNIQKNNLISLILLIISLFLIAEFAEAAKYKLRVKVTRANIRSNPTLEGKVISKAPLGAILDSEEKVGNWFKVVMPSQIERVVITGFIHQSTVEVIKEKKIKEKPSYETPTFYEIEPKKEFLNDPDYLKWRAEYNKAEKDLFTWKKYERIGIFTTLGGTALAICGALLSKESTTMLTLGTGVALGGSGLWIYGMVKKNKAYGRMLILKNKAEIRGYISTLINPEEKLYGISLSLEF